MHTSPTRYLAVLEQAQGNLSGYFPDVPGCVSTGTTREELLENLAEALAVHLDDLPMDAWPLVRTSAPSDVEDFSEGAEVEWVEPAPSNPLSLEIGRVIKASNLNWTQIADRMHTSRAAVRRLTDPFYWGHTVTNMRALAQALGFVYDPIQHFFKPLTLPDDAIRRYYYGGMRVPNQVLVADVPELEKVELPVVVTDGSRTFRLLRKSHGRFQGSDGTMYDAMRLT